MSHHLPLWLPRSEATPSSASQETASWLPGLGPRSLAARPQEQPQILLLAGEVGFWIRAWQKLYLQASEDPCQFSFQVSPVSQLRGSEALG